jgi:hypothetical protein
MRLAALAFALASLASLGACKKSGCLSSKTENVAGGVRMEWAQCPDDHNHVIDCNMRGDDYTCNCNPGDSFDMKLVKGQMPTSFTAEQAREGCKWDFTP